jgi:DNA-binding CsgD family transcriptional regulator
MRPSSRGGNWTSEQDEQLIRLVKEGQSNEEIGKLFGTSESSVRSRLGRLRKQGRIPQRWKLNELDDVDIPVEVEVDDRAPTPPPPPPASSKRVMGDARTPDELIQRLVKLAKTGAELEEICDLLDMSPTRVRWLIKDAQEKGYIVDISGPYVGHRSPAAAASNTVSVPILPAGDSRIFAQMTDIHYGSKYCLADAVDDFVEIAYARGARTIALTGDIVEGMYRHARWELTHHGWMEQSSYVAQRLPQKPGLKYYGITGNHEETFEKEAGIDVCRAYVEVFREHGRDDLTMIGARGGRIRLVAPGDKHGAQVELWHPLGSGSYAISYKLQKRIESYAPGQKPDFLFCGHFHMSGMISVRGVHAFHGGTFQGGGGPFGNALGSSPAIGGWIVEYAQTTDGTLRWVRPQWVAYYESEQPRDVYMSR